MWLNDINNLCIYKSRYVNILTRYITPDEINELEEMQERKFALNHQDCESFLISKISSLEVLKVQGDVEELYKNVDHLQLSVKSFKHLKKLIFYQMIVTDEDLQIICQNCPQLKGLHLVKCFCEHFHDLRPGVNINIADICNFKELHELEIQPNKPTGSEWLLKWEYVKYILDTLQNLKYLNLKNFTITCSNEDKTDKSFLPSQSWLLETLDMGFITFDFWCTFTGFLKCCPNLRVLTIQTVDDKNIIVNFKVIEILGSYCTNLQKLKLENCELNVKNFCLLQALQELTLSSCRGFTFNNLQQVLGGMKLKVFKLFHTRIFEEHNYIYISHTLESITIDTIHLREISEIFQRSLNKFSGLKTLWLNGDILYNWILGKCPQLQELHLTNPFNLWGIVLHMNCLQVLTLTSLTDLSWGLVHYLITKMPLKRLYINCNNIILGKRNSLRIPTTLELLVIPLRTFIMGVKNWLELLEINKNLKIIIFGKADTILNVGFISSLLAADCVRQRSKRIKICGFELELENFENSTISREIAYAQINTRHYKERKRPFTLEL